MNDTQRALVLIHRSLQEINDQLAAIQRDIRKQAKREELRLQEAERRIDALERRTQRLEQPISY